MPYRTELKRPDLKGNFPCSVCGKVFCHSSSLSRHRMQAHFKSYTCSQCNQEITSNDTLRTHMYKYHQISRMFMCRCCNWAFPDKTSLHIHMQSMTRTGRPGDVAVLARSSIEGEGYHHMVGDVDGATHSQSSSPHDPNDSAEPLEAKLTTRHVHHARTQPKLNVNSSAAQQLLSNPEFLGALSAFINQNTVSAAAPSAKQHMADMVFPSPQPQQNHYGNGTNDVDNYDTYAELLKRVKSGETLSKELVYMLSGALAPASPAPTTVASASVVATSPPTPRTQQQQQQQQLLLGFLKNNPHLATTDNVNGDSKAFISATLSALSHNNGQQQASQPQHLPHTPSNGTLAMRSDISRLLSITTGGGAPAAKRARVSSGAAVSAPNAAVLSALKVLQRAQNLNSTKTEPADEFPAENGLNLFISTSLAGMHAAEVPHLNTENRSTAFSPRAETPNGKTLDTILDKMRANSSERAVSALDASTGCVTPTGERRNKRKARAPQHVKVELSDATHLPAAPTGVFENIARMAAAVGRDGYAPSEQPSPAVSDSQTSGSSSATATAALLELISGTKTVANSATVKVETTVAPSTGVVFCDECENAKKMSKVLQRRIAELENQLHSKQASQHSVDVSDYDMKSNLEKIYSIANGADSRPEDALDCIREILALTKQFVDIPCESADVPRPELNEEFDTNNDKPESNENELNIDEDDEVEAEDEDDTIEIQCGPNPDDVEPDGEAPTPSPKPDITSAQD